MNGKQAKNLRTLVKNQFKGPQYAKFTDQIYNRLKVAWDKTPKNQRANFLAFLREGNNLMGLVNKK